MISAYLATLQGVKIKYAKQQITWPKLVSEVMGQLGHHFMAPNFISDFRDGFYTVTDVTFIYFIDMHVFRWI